METLEHIEILPATDADYPIVKNLVRFYVYDFTEFCGWDCPENGLFDGSDDLPRYWGRAPENLAYDWQPSWKGYPFLVRIAGKLAGFALVRQMSDDPPSFDMGEFFVLRKYRRQGVGRHIAHAMFDRFRGRWQVKQLGCNTPAQVFWWRVIDTYTNGDFQDEALPLRPNHQGEPDTVQRFNSGSIKN